MITALYDGSGEGVLVIKAKRPGRDLSLKDYPYHTYYLDMPSIRAVGRRCYAILADVKDRARFNATIGSKGRILIWQQMIALQVAEIKKLGLDRLIEERLAQSIIAYAQYLGIESDGATALRDDFGRVARGTAERYAAIRELRLPPAVEGYLLGSEVVFAARNELMPEPPHEWLRQEPDYPSIVCGEEQTTADRRIARWRLGWKPTR